MKLYLQEAPLRRICIVVLVLASSLTFTASVEGAVPKMSYVQSQLKTLKPGAVAVTQKVSCPAGTKVSGGGVASIGDAVVPGHFVVTSAPFDNGDAGRVPDDGWKGSASNTTDEPTRMQTYAFCMSGGKFRYVTAKSSFLGGAHGEAVAYCNKDAGEHVTGGGAVLSGKHPAIELGFSSPAEIDPVPDDGWHAAINNGSPDFQTIKVTAICERTHEYSYPSGSPILFPPGSKWAATACFEDALVGAGIHIGGADSNAYVQVVGQPLDSADADDLTDDGAYSQIQNTGTANLTYVPTIICLVSQA